MLVLTRKPGESIKIGENIEVKYLSSNYTSYGKCPIIKLGFIAPDEVNIVRTEIIGTSRKEKKPDIIDDIEISTI